MSYREPKGEGVFMGGGVWGEVWVLGYVPVELGI